MTTTSKKARRAKAAQQRKQQNLLWIGGAALVAALLIAAIFVSIRNQRPVGDEQRLRSQGNTHIELEAASPIDYNSTPPTSGPHYPTVAPWRVHTDPVRYEQIVHNLEDGGVAIYYQCADGCPELVAQLEQVATPYLNGGRHVLVAPNDPNWSVGGDQPHQDMGNRIALTAWQRIDKFDEFDAKRIQAFIERYEGLDHH